MLLPMFVFSQKITLDVEKQPMEKVLVEIEKQSGFKFIYSDESMAISRPVTLKVRGAEVTEVLVSCFKGQPIGYEIQDRHVIIRIKPVEKVITQRPLKGRITNEENLPLAGVSVRILSTNIPLIATDQDGEFSFPDVPAGSRLRVSGAEIEPLEMAVGNKSYILISVKAKLGTLSETLIKGYYKTSRKLNTGSVGKITSRDIATQPVSNPIAALQGRISGLFITQASGLPGSPFTVVIRGRNSIQNGNEPLYVVDGVIFSSENLTLRSNIQVNNPFNTIVPEDIESIEVLKDADATALYGSRGANGVILITTKRGRDGRAKLEATFSTGWGAVSRTMDYMNTEQYLAMRREAFANDGRAMTISNAGDLLLWDTTRYNDFKKEIIGGTAHTTNAQLRYSGGTELTQFSVSTNQYRESTVFPGDFADNRFSLATTLSNRSADSRLQISLSSNYAQERNRLMSQDLSGALRLAPHAPQLRNPEGNLVWGEGGWGFDNPLGGTLRSYKADIDRFTSSAGLSYVPVKGLTFRANGGINRVHLREQTLIPIASQNSAFNPKGTANFGTNALSSWTAEFQGEYVFPVADWLRVRAMAGTSWQHSITEGSVQSGNGYTSDAMLGSISGAATVTSSDNYSRYRYQALFARVELNHRDKFIVNLTGRRDGSSRFGPGRQYANFGAAGFAWIFSSDNNLLVNWLNFGKFRASYGITGNDQIGDYQYFDTYQPAAYPYAGSLGLRPSRHFNPDYGWEQKANLDIAMELGFFKNRILFNVGSFRSITGNQILQYTLPGQTGFTSITRNFPGQVENKGFELEIISRNISIKQFSWTSSLNLTFARNKLLKFPGLQESSYSNMYMVGKPLNIRFLYEYNGVDPTTGIYNFTDVNQDGRINSADRTTVRHLSPDFYGGFQNTVRFRKWELTCLFQFVKQDGAEAVFTSFTAAGMAINQPHLVLDRWQQPGDQSRYQRFTAGSGEASTAANRVANSTAIVTDASYVRLKNLALNYTINPDTVKRWKISSATMFAQAQNLLTITSYRGADPENQSITAIPPLRMIVVGTRLIF
ncbi:MAG: SusC/RagA family TonB-linked outer membrane protein [Chitinophagaceae bacterium]